MSDPIISAILTQVATIMAEMIRAEIRLISGVEKEVKNLTRTFDNLQAVLIDAEKRQVKEETVKVWLQNVKDVSYDAEDVLSEWITEIQKSKNDLGAEESSNPIYQKVRSFVTLPWVRVRRVALRRDIALQIEEINKRLDLIAVDKDRYRLNVLDGDDSLGRVRQTTSYVNVSEIRGRDLDKDTLIKKMLSKENQEKGLNVISILGLGGMGKTTLAQHVYNSDSVDQHFETRIWTSVSEPFDEIRVAKAMVEVVEGKAPHLFELETLLRRLRENVQGKRYLLVLDDVWTGEGQKWEQIFTSLRTGAAGSTILVTTRHEMVAKLMGSSYELLLRGLEAHDSWSLFSQIAFFERAEEDEELKVVGRQIADKCKGLPLFLKTIGSLMRFKTSLEEWNEVLVSEFWKLEEAEKGLLSPFMLSYYDLPKPLKRCFQFCAFFPKDHSIEADNLSKLWMAQGYLKPTEDEEMEKVGQKYLQNLAMRSLFQDLVKDKDDKKILRFKIHDMVHEFAQYLTKDECYLVEVNKDLVRKMESSQKKARHLTLVRSEDAHFPDFIPNVEKLHSLWVQCFYDCPLILNQLDTIEPEFFHRLSRVKALDLSRNMLGKLPKEVGKLMNLKHLNLSHNPLCEMPQTLGDLYNLQTLNLTSCIHLEKLPQTIRKLVNLRHLEIDQTNSLKALPRGINRLTSLQTLSKFVISGQEDNGEEAACRITDLESLNNLRGRLKIEGLGYAADPEDAKKAEMQKKEHLSDLHLDFGPITQSCSRQNEVIQTLQVHTNLQVLRISSYGGTKLPNWIMILTNMIELRLQDCQNCTNLPSLGKLPSLVTLYIEGMRNIKRIGLEFLGLGVGGDSNMNGGGNRARTAFPKLKKLKISKMESWEEWDFLNGGSLDETVKVMPCLKLLKLVNCSKLKALPEHLILPDTPLLKLRIHNCTLLQERFKETGEVCSKTAHISKVKIT